MSEPPPLPRKPAYEKTPMGQDIAMRTLLPVGRSGWAIAAGYAGLFSLAIVGAPFAVIFGILAILDIRKSRGTDTPKYGMGRAIFGILSGLFAIGVVIWIMVRMAKF